MRIFLHRIRSLVIKELQGLLTDPQSRRLLILPVILQMLLFPNAATLEVKHATIAIFNEDMGEPANDLIQRLATAEAFREIIMIHSDEEMQKLIDRQDAIVALRFPPDFSRKVVSGQNAVIQAILDGRKSNASQIVLGYVQEILFDYQSDRAREEGKPVLSQLVVRHWFNPNLDYVFFIVPNLIGTITTLGALIITSLSVAREREQGTFDQLLVSPLTPEMIMIGKAIPAIIVAMFQATLILLAAVFIYHVPFQGSLLLLYGSMLFYTIALVGFGLLISSICQTQQQAFLGTFCFLMPAILLSGYTSPIENMPEWLQTLTWGNPMRHFMTIVKSIFLKDISLANLVHSLFPLLIIAVVTLSTSVWMFRRRAA